jgi:hypothetical protein
MAQMPHLRGWFAGVVLAGLCVGWSGPTVAERPAVGPDPLDVDVELVLAVDISHSMKEDEQELQRNGYIRALTSSDFLAALRTGPYGRIAVTYIEWAESDVQRVVIDWALVEDEASARKVAARLAAMPLHSGNFTSISSAISFATARFGQGFRGLRRVIDVSGDGPNNHGPPIEEARAAALAAGVIINGLPILIRDGESADSPALSDYYSACVIGGEGAFVEPVHTALDFDRAVRTKLVREVAGLQWQQPRIIPAAMRNPPAPANLGCPGAN